MSQYDKQFDGNNSICPYCSHAYQVEGEDYDNCDHEVECDECGKKYWLCQEYEVTHITRPDCALNGIEHQWVYYKNVRGDFRRCEVCDELKFISLAKEDKG